MDADIIISDQKARADLEHLHGLSRDRQLATVLDWAAGRDAGRQALAVSVLTTMGTDAARLLVQEALAPGKPTQRRVRLLATVERLGRPLDVGEWMKLVAEARRFGPAVRGEVARLLAWHRHASLPQAAPRAATGRDTGGIAAFMQPPAPAS